MKLSEIRIRPECRIPEMPLTHQKAADNIELSFDAGLVTIRRIDRNEPAFLIPLSCILFMRPATAEPESKAAKKAA